VLNEGDAADGRRLTALSVKEGGNQIEYQDEDPALHAGFEAELAAHGATCGMGDQSPYCSQRQHTNGAAREAVSATA
jgi:hypothetical protein